LYLNAESLSLCRRKYYKWQKPVDTVDNSSYPH